MPRNHAQKAGCEHETALEISSYRKLPELYWKAVLRLFVACGHVKLSKNQSKSAT
jgi:hypothetical protein